MDLSGVPEDQAEKFKQYVAEHPQYNWERGALILRSGKLGNVFDAELARQLGYEKHAIWKVRQICDIPSLGVSWKRSKTELTQLQAKLRDSKLLGTMSDYGVAVELDVEPSTVTRTRKRLGIPRYSGPRKVANKARGVLPKKYDHPPWNQ